VSDTATVRACRVILKNVIANDTDPEGNYPLALTGVSYSGDGYATVASSTSISFEAGSGTGTAVVNYTVQDSLGASATGKLTVTVTAATCV
jgi:hypothetical protein